MSDDTVTVNQILKIQKDTANTIADMLESYSRQDILLHAGEMTAQEMRTVTAIQKWWVAEIRRFFVVDY